MTTYAAPTTQQVPPPTGPPTLRPTTAAKPPRGPRRPRTGLIAAGGAFTLATVAAVAATLALANPTRPAQNTVNVVPPPAADYASSDIEAAKTTACTAWDRAARSTAQASRASATALEAEPSSEAPTSAAALAAEKRTGIAAVSNLRNSIGPATPQAVADHMNQWIALSINELHAMNQRNWADAEKVQQQGNALVDTIASECGLR